MVRSRRGGGRGGGFVAAEPGLPIRATARKAEWKQCKRAASLRAGLLFLLLDAGNSEPFRSLPATGPVRSSRRLDAKKQKEKKSKEKEKGRSRTRVGLWI